MNPGLFDMLHDTAYQHVFPVTDAIDINLGRKIEESVQQDRAVIRNVDSRIHVSGQIILAVHDFHRTTTQDIGRPDYERETDIGEWFEKFYSIRFRNYPVSADYLHQPQIVPCR